MEGCSSKLVTVSSSDYAGALSHALFYYLETKHLVDVDFRVRGRIIPAHRLILELFLTPEKIEGGGDTSEDVVDDAESDKSLGHLLLEFIYKGEVAVPEEKLDCLLGLAKELDFEMLADAVESSKRLVASYAIDGNSIARSKTGPTNAGRGRRKMRHPIKSIRSGGSSLSQANRAINETSAKKRTRQSVANIPTTGICSKGRIIKPEEEANYAPTKKRTRKSAATVLGAGAVAGTVSSARGRRVSPRTNAGASLERSLTEEVPSSPEESSDESFHPNAESSRKPVQQPLPKKLPIARRRIRIRKKASEGHQGPLQPLLRCQLCDFKSRSRIGLDLHQAEHDPSIVVVKCEDCDKKFVSEETLKAHRQLHTDEPTMRHRCMHCSYKTPSRSRFLVHQALHDPSVTIVKCSWCTKKFTDQELLARHKCVRLSGANLYRCPHCEYTTAHWVRSRVHIASKHDPSIQVFRCSSCSRPFLSEEQRDTHRCWLRSPEAKLFRCADCKFSSKLPSQLKYHVQAMHSPPIYRCSASADCDYATGRKNDLKRHVEVTHLDIKKYVCDLCGHRSITQQSLTNHIATHVGAKPYSCPTCCRTFTNKSTCKRHVRRHLSDERPFVCHVCGNAFNRRDNLRVHLKNVHKAEMNSASPK